MAAPAPRLNVLHVATINKPIHQGNGYGPIESVIYNIDRGLTALGHRSIVACSDDSRVAGEHWPTVSKSLGDYCLDRTPSIEAQIDLHLANALARARVGDIDVVHMHEWHDRVFNGTFNPGVPVVMTLHVPAHRSDIGSDLRRARAAGTAGRVQLHAVAISEYQRRQYRDLIEVAETVPHGIDVNDYLFTGTSEPGGYLFHIGRITEDKGQDIAIEVAKRAGMKLILAGYVQNKVEDRAFFKHLRRSIDSVIELPRHRAGPNYYEEVMRPILASASQVTYIGELAGEATKHWYSRARATLFPIRWGEPFGMVLIESMASGTPVLAFGKGAVPEIIDDGKTGFISDSVDSMVSALRNIELIDRRACREHVQMNFSTQLMASRYAAVYEGLTGPRQDRAALPGRSASFVHSRLPLLSAS
jgi:glycosyltransferase involved in cell wall biosynthesis